MHAMHYEITLPGDYDMQIIRDRVKRKGHLLDAFPGLGFKAYLIRERGADGSPVNQYAPFYLWNSVRGMNAFLWGEGFRGLTQDFGRPPVQHWTVLAFEPGPAFSATPRTATRRTESVPADTDPAATVEHALGELRRRADGPGVHSSVLAVDTRHWELVHFTLWEHAAPTAEGACYEVLHLSAPEVDDIEAGRLW